MHTQGIISMSGPIQLTPEQQEALVRLSAQSGKPWEDILSEAISAAELHVKGDRASSESVYDAMNRLGLLGCVTDGDSDLSTNPVHMEGFGSGGR
jgi:hypothetical protein